MHLVLGRFNVTQKHFEFIEFLFVGNMLQHKGAFLWKQTVEFFGAQEALQVFGLIGERFLCAHDFSIMKRNESKSSLYSCRIPLSSLRV